jgi:hypothetical protein
VHYYISALLKAPPPPAASSEEAHAMTSLPEHTFKFTGLLPSEDNQ